MQKITTTTSFLDVKFFIQDMTDFYKGRVGFLGLLMNIVSGHHSEIWGNKLS